MQSYDTKGLFIVLASQPSLRDYMKLSRASRRWNAGL